MTMDLHMHSCFSDDGQYTPEQLVDIAIKSNLKTIAITDHNSVKAIDRAKEYAKDKGIEVISGIEITCMYKEYELHLLGYNIDYKSDDFLDLENAILEEELRIIPLKIAKVNEYFNVNLNLDEILEEIGDTILNGEKIAEFLFKLDGAKDREEFKPYFEGGSRSDNPLVNFYWDYFHKGCPCYVDMDIISFSDAVKLIKKHNGTPILAHPGQHFDKSTYHVIDELLDIGAMGLEVFSNYHTLDTTTYFYNKVKDLGLTYTMGSDFHGDIKPNIKMGKYLSFIDEDFVKNNLI